MDKQTESVKRPFVLIVEDDEDMAELNARMLKRRGYGNAAAYTASQARELAAKYKPDLIVMDIVLPDGDGLSLCKELRRYSDVPVLFLTGQTDLDSKIAGLSAGGDYYLTKPYSAEELLVVIKRLLQRALQVRNSIIDSTTITKGPLTLHIPTRACLLRGQDIELTSKEFAILLLLMRNENVEIQSEQIFESVWNLPMGSNTGALRVQIARMKRKLDEENTDEFSITYSRGRGYCFTTK